jgi:hypothetical protein
MTIMGSRNALAEDFTQIIALMKEGKIDTEAWITHHTNMEKLAEDFPTYLDPASKANPLRVVNICLLGLMSWERSKRFAPAARKLS